MMACWSESPSGRPDFSTIRKVVHTLNKYYNFFKFFYQKIPF